MMIAARSTTGVVALALMVLSSVPAVAAAQKRERVILDSDTPGGVHVTISAMTTDEGGAGVRVVAESGTDLVHCFFWPTNIAEWQDTARAILDNATIAEEQVQKGE